MGQIRMAAIAPVSAPTRLAVGKKPFTGKLVSRVSVERQRGTQHVLRAYALALVPQRPPCRRAPPTAAMLFPSQTVPWLPIKHLIACAEN
jgi:hypothetical protein